MELFVQLDPLLERKALVLELGQDPVHLLQLLVGDALHRLVHGAELQNFAHLCQVVALDAVDLHDAVDGIHDGIVFRSGDIGSTAVLERDQAPFLQQLESFPDDRSADIVLFGKLHLAGKFLSHFTGGRGEDHLLQMVCNLLAEVYP